MYCWIDTETGGLDPARDALLQVAAIWTNDDFQILHYLMSYIKPSPALQIHPKALEINKINVKALETAPTEDQVLTAIMIMNGSDVPVFGGYNVEFDRKFIKHACFRAGVDLQFSGEHDVMLIAEKRYSRRLKLVDLCHKLEVASKGAHDAARDIHMTIQCGRILAGKTDNYTSPRVVEVEQIKL